MKASELSNIQIQLGTYKAFKTIFEYYEKKVPSEAVFTPDSFEVIEQNRMGYSFDIKVPVRMIMAQLNARIETLKAELESLGIELE